MKPPDRISFRSSVRRCDRCRSLTWGITPSLQNDIMYIIGQLGIILEGVARSDFDSSTFRLVTHRFPLASARVAGHILVPAGPTARSITLEPEAFTRKPPGPCVRGSAPPGWPALPGQDLKASSSGLSGGICEPRTSGVAPAPRDAPRASSLGYHRMTCRHLKLKSSQIPRNGRLPEPSPI